MLPLELNYNSEDAKKTLRATLSNLPPDVEVYLIGGAIRNALIRMIHGITLPRRDYDQVVTKGSTSYETYLKNLGYE